MKNHSISSVVFDIGNVLISWDPRNLYTNHITDPEELNWFLKEVVTLEWHTNHDRGLSFAEGIKTLSQKHPTYREMISLFDEKWRDTIAGEISGTVKILKALKKRGTPLFALSNYSKEKLPELGAEFDFVDCFDGLVISGEEGVVKPDPRIYQITKERFNLRDGDALFIDDRAENIEVSEAQGFIGHHFISPEQLEKALQGYGLL